MQSRPDNKAFVYLSLGVVIVEILFEEGGLTQQNCRILQTTKMHETNSNVLSLNFNSNLFLRVQLATWTNRKFHVVSKHRPELIPAWINHYIHYKVCD